MPQADTNALIGQFNAKTPYGLELDIIKLDFDQVRTAGMNLLLDAVEARILTGPCSSP